MGTVGEVGLPVLLVVGRKEAAEQSVSIRRFGSPDQTSLSLHDALALLADEAIAPDLRRLHSES